MRSFFIFTNVGQVFSSAGVVMCAFVCFHLRPLHILLHRQSVKMWAWKAWVENSVRCRFVASAWAALMGLAAEFDCIWNLEHPRWTGATSRSSPITRICVLEVSSVSYSSHGYFCLLLGRFGSIKLHQLEEPFPWLTLGDRLKGVRPTLVPRHG